MRTNHHFAATDTIDIGRNGPEDHPTRTEPNGGSAMKTGQKLSMNRTRNDHEAKRTVIGIFLALLALLGPVSSRAQTVCPPGVTLGANGIQLCVEVYDEGTGSTRTWQGTNQVPVIGTVGDYGVSLMVNYVLGPTGMAVTIEGPVWRVGAGTGRLNVRADGGGTIALAEGEGSLLLDGTATGASNTHLGGGAGFRHISGDIEFRTFSATVERSTYGPGAFFGELDDVPVAEGAIAVTNITSFHVNELWDEIEIPSTVTLNDPPLNDLPGRRWRDLLVDATLMPDENRAAAITSGDQPNILVTDIWHCETANHLYAWLVEPPYGRADIVDYGELDSGFLFSNHKICPTGENRAIVPYIKGEGANTSVWFAEYVDGDFTMQQVEETTADDYHDVTCFETANGLFFRALNYTDQTVEIFKRAPSGDFERWWTLDGDDLGGDPESPWLGTAIGKAAGHPDKGVAVLTSGLENGTLAVAQFRTDTPQLIGLWNAGPASGETSIDMVWDETRMCYKASMNWMAQSEFKFSYWCTEAGLARRRVIRLGTVETGTLIPQFQGVAGIGTPDGSSYSIADRAYMVDALDTVTELPTYPYRTRGGPVDLTFVGAPGIEAVAAGPGSQMLGFLKPPDSADGLAVPAVARVAGSGAFFTSVMHLFNGGEHSLDIDMTFTPRTGSGGAAKTVSHTIPAGLMHTINDPLKTLFRFGGSADRVGSLLMTVKEGYPTDLKAQTVVFAELDSGEEYGQFFPAMGTADAVSAGQTAYLNTTEDPAHNRVNVGLMAASNGTRFTVTPVNPLGQALAPARTVDLEKGDNTQINNIHSSFGLGSIADVVVQVEVVSGSGFAYASVLDGSGNYDGTSDPTTILPVLDGSDRVTLLEIGSIQGLNEFSGSASMTNYSDRTAAVRADFYLRGSPGIAASETVMLAAGGTVGFTDLGADLFGISGDVGTVELSTTNGTKIGATGREFAIFRGPGGGIIGTAGQLMGGLTNVDRLTAGRTYHFIGLRQTKGGGPIERSHFAVFNPATTDALVTIRLYDGATGAVEGTESWVVPSKTLIQVNNLIRAINPGHDTGEKRIEVEVNRSVYMNAFRVNRWGDPVTLSPFPG